jgi:hypothetical protein
MAMPYEPEHDRGNFKMPMTSKQIARFNAIRKATKSRQDAPAGQPKRMPRSARAKVSVTQDDLLAACVAASGFDEHRFAA